MAFNKHTRKIEFWHDPNRPTDRDIEKMLE
jgi:hypothetical protein